MGEGRDELFAGKLVPSSVVHLHPEDAVVEGMLRAWAAQGRSRGLASGSVATRQRLIRVKRRVSVALGPGGRGGVVGAPA